MNNRLSKTTKICAPALGLALSLTSAVAQEIQRLDPAADQLVPASAKLEKVAGGFDKWTEGPVWTRAGGLLFAVIPPNEIVQWSPGKGAQRFMKPSGYVGPSA